MTSTIEPTIQARVRDLPRTCVLFALPQERKSFRAVESSRLKIAVSGTGPDNARKAAKALISHPGNRAGLLVICGFCGALKPDMRPGDLFLAERVVNATEGLEYVSESLEPDPTLTDRLRAMHVAEAKIHTGILVTSNAILTTAHDKREWSARTGARAVDMETAAAAAVAAAEGVKWIAIRAVTDDSDTDMPLDFNRLTGADGNTNMAKLLCAVALRPWCIPGLIQLGKATSVAARNLSKLLEVLVKSTKSVEEVDIGA